ncbi:very short patch repair endonuclease [Pseudonocardia xinjiangensis]|uniref:very short patch repair endonuclease n=1 Tax=Pseudonocardia xinjiangensis TaxID=75289 RepID=UPI003D8A0CB9
MTPPRASSETIRRRMSRQRRTNTKPEMDVRRQLHAAGLRYRVDVRLEADLRVRGDIVWAQDRIVVFVDGCYWHRCPLHSTAPKSNADWWQTKLEENTARDRRVDQILRKRGWLVLRFWEHEDPRKVASAIKDQLAERRRSNPRPMRQRVLPS